MRENSSRIELIASLEESERASLLKSLTDRAALELLYDWEVWARPSQVLPPGDWSVAFYCAGRGAGKTRVGAEWIRKRVESGIARRIALVAETPSDARDIMVEGESGLLAVCPPWNRPEYEPSKRRLTWTNPSYPSNGAQAFIYTSAEPDWLRGPQFDTAWGDEIAAWRYPRETWDNLLMGLRLGDNPKVLATSTPRPIALVRELIKDPDVPKLTGSTFENAANLPPTFFRELIKRYKGTRTGRQELYAELLEEADGALWTRATIDRDRIDESEVPDLVRVVVAVDPAVTSNDSSDSTGIVVGGIGVDGLGYCLADRSCRVSPAKWGERAINSYVEFEANEVVAETNNGGDLVVENLRIAGNRQDVRSVPVRKIHASRGKRTRAEPVASLSEQGRIKFVGSFPDLEDQLCNWEPNSGASSPDRLDAFVWAFSRLMVKPGRVKQRRVSQW